MVTLSGRSYRAVCGTAFASLCIIVFTGALVRLTGSGLGCSDWPRCNDTHFVDISSSHTLIEQANRLFTGVVSLSVIAAVLMSHRRSPRRKDLIALAWGLVLGVVAQIVIGGIVVLTGLNPYANMAHFLVSLLLIACSYLLYQRSAGDVNDPWRRQLPQRMRTFSVTYFVSSVVAIVAGTVVTATGPHAGNEEAVRFGFALESVARIHSIAVLVSIGLLVYIALNTKKMNVDSMFEAVQVCLFVAVLQAIVGYAQYFTDVPVTLVAIHIAGAVSFFIASFRLVVQPNTSVG